MPERFPTIPSPEVPTGEPGEIPVPEQEYSPEMIDKIQDNLRKAELRKSLGIYAAENEDEKVRDNLKNLIDELNKID
jgi:hypothetical protein